MITITFKKINIEIIITTWNSEGDVIGDEILEVS